LKITDYEKMKAIVANNDKLSWDGWNVVAIYKDDDGFFELDGVFKEGKWHVKRTYELKEDGWDIPLRLLRAK
jgi:hypothetical protein